MATKFNATLFGSIFSQVIRPGTPSEGENALGRLKNYLETNDIHPADMKFSLEDDGSLVVRQLAVITRLENQIAVLAREVGYFRRSSDADVIAAAAKRRDIPDHWEDFIALVERKFCLKDGTLPSRWKKTVSDLLLVTSRALSAWESRRVRVPEDAMEKLQALPDSEWVAQAQRRKVKDDTESTVPTKSRKPGRKSFPWHDHPELHRRVVELFLDGGGRTEIARAVGYVDGVDDDAIPNPQQVQTITLNDLPPSFLNISVRANGPLDRPEAWLIAATCFLDTKTGVRSWLAHLKTALRMEHSGETGIGFDLSTVPDDVVAEFRDRYRQTLVRREKDDLAALLRRGKKVERKARSENQIESLFRAAGPSGSAFRDLPVIRDLDPTVDGHQRVKSLVRELTLIETVQRNANGQTVLVHRDFASDWPREWEIAQSLYGGTAKPTKPKKTIVSALTPSQVKVVIDMYTDGKSDKQIIQNLLFNDGVTVTRSLLQRAIAAANRSDAEVEDAA